MRKHKRNTPDAAQQWDSGVYHTGAAQPPRRSNGLVSVLLVAVILLGGMASALGILNFRLLSMQTHTNTPVNPISEDSVTVATNPNAFFNSNDDPAPSVPADRDAKMDLAAPADDMTATQIYEHNEQALVSVYCTTRGNETLSGTGVTLSEDGYILTNAHLVESAQRIYVYLPDGRLLRASMVGSDPFTDLAVLYIQASDLTPAIFTDTTQLQPQETVYALKDQPDADYNLILSGQVIRLQTLTAGDLSLSVLQTGLHGTFGPVFDSQGRIVAIQAGKISRYFPDDITGGCAIPVETVHAVVSELMENGFISGRPALGIQVETISKLYQYYWDLPGGLLVTVAGDAESGGLQDGDILLTLDGVHLTSRAELYATLYDASIGDELIAAVFRDGRTFTLTLTVEENTQP